MQVILLAIMWLVKEVEIFKYSKNMFLGIQTVYNLIVPGQHTSCCHLLLEFITRTVKVSNTQEKSLFFAYRESEINALHGLVMKFNVVYT